MNSNSIVFFEFKFEFKKFYFSSPSSVKTSEFKFEFAALILIGLRTVIMLKHFSILLDLLDVLNTSRTRHRLSVLGLL